MKRGPENLFFASLVLLVLVVFYAMLAAYGMPTNAALGFTLLAGCILCLVLFTLRIGHIDRNRHKHDH